MPCRADDKKRYQPCRNPAWKHGWFGKKAGYKACKSTALIALVCDKGKAWRIRHEAWQAREEEKAWRVREGLPTRDSDFSHVPRISGVPVSRMRVSFPGIPSSEIY